MESLSPKEWIESFFYLLRLAFDNHVPNYVLQVVAWFLLGCVVIVAIWVLFHSVSKIIRISSDVIIPAFYSAEKRKRSARRRRFADHVEAEIRRLNNLEQWSDYRFAELEAEVEAEGRTLSWGIWRPNRNGGLRREKSLSRALRRSRERLILLEGEPGSGKSVALRFVARQLATRAMHGRGLNTLVPIYINLKNLERESSQRIDQNLIRTYVLSQLNRINDRDVDAYLDAEFDAGLRSGTWLFLFDSFDEIPEVLSAVEASDPIQQYADAIADFLYGMNQCRGVVASRQFRGPAHLGWPKFRILKLSIKRQVELVKKCGLENSTEMEIIAGIKSPSADMGVVTSNPMFLGLLAEHVRRGKRFPQNLHVLLEGFVSSRFHQDADKLRKRFGLGHGQVRTMAEWLAFCMAADNALGLSPTRDGLRASLCKFAAIPDHFDRALDALEFLKLARAEVNQVPGTSRSFTFAHRRFQEYFATCIVLRDAHRISPNQLIEDGRWRETAVVLLSTRPTSKVTAVLERAFDLVKDFGRQIQERAGQVFEWPEKSLHVLGLLNAAYLGRAAQLPDQLRMQVGEILETAYTSGTILNKQWATELVGILPERHLLAFLERAFRDASEWVRSTAFTQVGNLGKLAPQLRLQIRQRLLQHYIQGRRDRVSTKAYLHRLDSDREFLRFEQLIWVLPFADFALSVAWLSAASVYASTDLHVPALLITAISTAIATAIYVRLNVANVTRNSFWYLLQAFKAIFFVIVGRAQFLMLPAGIKLVKSFHLRGEIDLALFLAAGVYVAAWAPAAYWCAMNGETVRLMEWPILPLKFAAKTICRIPEKLKNLRNNADVIVVVVLSLSAIAGVIVGGILISRKYPLIGITLHVLSLVAVACGCYAFVRPLLTHAVATYRDWRRWKRLHPLKQSFFADELICILKDFETSLFRCKFLRYVRLIGGVNSDRASLERLHKFASQVEAALEASADKPSELMTFHVMSRGWRSDRRNWDATTADELYKLIQERILTRATVLSAAVS